MRLPWAPLTLLVATTAGLASELPTTVDLNALSWFYGRDYFVLRSGRAQMIIQADKADLGPAVTFLLFDNKNARQSAHKQNALNWEKETGVQSSALEVVLGGFAYTALGHRTETGWDLVEGSIPSVRATWWAGGIRVTEHFVALRGEGLFERDIELEGAHLAGPEEVTSRLRVPELCASLRLFAVENGTPSTAATPGTKSLELGPLHVEPGARVRLVTLLQATIPPDANSIDTNAATITAGARRAATAKTASYWANQSRITAGDKVVRDIFDKARFQLAGMVAEDGTMNAGIFEYGAQWVRDTSNTALGALHAGDFETARACLVRMLTSMVSREGATMIANAFVQPDLEQFDQMGELLHLLKAYRDWTGDDSLLREHRELLIAMVERPLRPEFRDETGMVHNRREFWERTFTDAYELAYQTMVIRGLLDAADLAIPLGAETQAPRWRAEAERIRQALLHHPTKALVNDCHLIKRRKVTGEIADDPADFAGFNTDVPLRTEHTHRLMPDASMALPIALGVVDPHSVVAQRTLDFLEALWNTRWPDGGYDRYHTSSQPDQPGPWPFATTFILRAQHEAGQWDRSRRSLEWLNTAAGGRTGAWYEEISSIRSQTRACGLVPWTSGEVTLFVVRHYLGVRFDGDKLVIRPKLYPRSQPVVADLRFRQGRLCLDIGANGRLKSVAFNGRPQRVSREGSVNGPQ